MEAYRIHMGKAKCAVDLGDGSERGAYVNQDYILEKLGRPHRSISLMYCYYPLDEGWPGRASVVHANPDVRFAWDFPYDDYFTYKGGLEGNTDGEPFQYMREIRQHGQDVNLTMTIDPHVSDEQLAAIGRDLRPFGRVFLRINHEATGNWFSFNKRCTYQEVADFFVRASRIIKEQAPNVQTVICIGGIESLDKEEMEMEMEKEFAQTIPAADIWSVDKYMSLHWGWPYDVAESGGNSHSRGSVADTFEMTKRSFERFRYLNGGTPKPMTMAEFNADGDVTGAYEQAEMVKMFCDMVEQKQATWFSGFTFYQFRDQGRLGLEIENPNNPDTGFEQPVVQTYKEIIHRDWFSPEITRQAGEVTLPLNLRWSNSEDAEGVAIPLHFEKNPIFCEAVFEEDSNLMLELNGKWFYKAPQTKMVDLMGAFFEKPLKGAADLTLKIFAPPATGENDLSKPDGLYHSDTILRELSKVRIRFSAIEPSRD
ncbi:MAG: hypothetical protein LUF89_03065 [Ruminococcus sp.]|nr:hypothetical protein [Ruminococcus sp.]